MLQNACLRRSLTQAEKRAIAALDQSHSAPDETDDLAAEVMRLPRSPCQLGVTEQPFGDAAIACAGGMPVKRPQHQENATSPLARQCRHRSDRRSTGASTP